MNHYTEVSTERQRKQRKFFLVLPLIVLPFLTFLLWSMGWVGGNEAKAAQVKGLNMQLPDAKLKDNKSWNKLSFYEQADKDSAKYRDAVKNDPFFHRNVDSLVQASSPLDRSSSFSYNPLPPGNTDANEYKVAQKLAQLNAVIDNNNKANESLNDRNKSEPITSSFQTKDVDRLEQMLQRVNGPDSGTDPENEQLNGMMDKILDIQHPERVSERIRRESQKNKRAVYPVVLKQRNNVTSILQKNDQGGRSDNKHGIQPPKQATFYSLTDDTTREEKQNTIEAQIQQTQTLVSGSTVKLSLTTDVYVNGVLVPKGTLLYGIASQNGERLNIAIPAIHYGNSLLPVSLTVYDLDGLPGIYIPGSITRDAVKQSGSEAVTNIGITSLDPSLTAQAASAGIQAAKSLINKKVKQVKVTVKAGYQVLLYDNQK